LAWGDTSLDNDHEKFFTPLQSLEIGQLELEKVYFNHGILAKTCAHLEVNFCSHASDVKQFNSIYCIDSSHHPSFKNLKIQKMCHKKPIQVGSIAPHSTNANVDAHLVHTHSSTIGLYASSFGSRTCQKKNSN
jgi:hypothetical protein